MGVPGARRQQRELRPLGSRGEGLSGTEPDGTCAIALGAADPSSLTFAALGAASRPPHHAIELQPEDVSAAVSAASGIQLRVAPTSHPRALTRARRAALTFWSRTRRPRSTMVRALGLSSAAATKLSQSIVEDDAQLNAILAKALELLGHE